jgi:hypothetical protein
MAHTSLVPCCCRCASRLVLDRARRVLCCPTPSCVAYDPPRPGRNVVLESRNSYPAWAQRLQQRPDSHLAR